MSAESKKTILVVDDQPEMRTMLALTLSRNNWQVIEADNGEEAVKMATSERPQVILMDYNMPIMNGIDACKAIKSNKDTQEIPILIYTGMSAIEIEAEAFQAGAKRFMTKPILPNDLRNAIDAAFRGD